MTSLDQQIKQQIEIPHSLPEGLFITLNKAHVLAFKPLDQGLYDLELINVQSMFQIFNLVTNKVKYGMVLVTNLHYENNGGYVWTGMRKNLGKAGPALTLLRSPQIVIYEFPNVGSLAISPKVSTHVKNFFEDQ